MLVDLSSFQSGTMVGIGFLLLLFFWSPTFRRKGSYETASISVPVCHYVSMSVGQLTVFLKNDSLYFSKILHEARES